MLIYGYMALLSQISYCQEETTVAPETTTVLVPGESSAQTSGSDSGNVREKRGTIHIPIDANSYIDLKSVSSEVDAVKTEENEKLGGIVRDQVIPEVPILVPIPFLPNSESEHTSETQEVDQPIIQYEKPQIFQRMDSNLGKEPFGADILTPGYYRSPKQSHLDALAYTRPFDSPIKHFPHHQRIHHPPRIPQMLITRKEIPPPFIFPLPRNQFYTSPFLRLKKNIFNQLMG